MRMGLKEFRERISEVTASGKPVVITHHGKPVASYAPFRPKDPAAVRAAVDDVRAWQDASREQGVDLDAVLAGLGLNPMGEPLDDVSDR